MELGGRMVMGRIGYEDDRCEAMGLLASHFGGLWNLSGSILGSHWIFCRQSITSVRADWPGICCLSACLMLTRATSLMRRRE